jgi:hypothetical protein
MKNEKVNTKLPYSFPNKVSPFLISYFSFLIFNFNAPRVQFIKISSLHTA